MIGESNLIQCECKGWMSPRAIYCPTCGAPVEGGSKPPKQKRLPTEPSKTPAKVGWAIVRAFWGVATTYIAVWLLFV